MSSSEPIPLTAWALDQLDAQVAATAGKFRIEPDKSPTASSSNMHDDWRNDPDLHNISNRIVESDKTGSVFESEISKGKMRLPSAEYFFFSFG